MGIQGFLKELHTLCREHGVTIIGEDGPKGKEFTMTMVDGSEVEFIQVMPSKSEITMKRDTYVAS